MCRQTVYDQEATAGAEAKEKNVVGADEGNGDNAGPSTIHLTSTSTLLLTAGSQETNTAGAVGAAGAGNGCVAPVTVTVSAPDVTVTVVSCSFPLTHS